jgi:AmmeMemoRadiSam system protein A
MQNQGDAAQPLTPQQGSALVALVRQTLLRHFGATVAGTDVRQLETVLAEPPFQARCGVFVTLKIDQGLRGCIGSLTTSDPIVAGVRKNALNAALHDPRFAPLRRADLDRLQIEVSVLSHPAPLAYTDADDLLAKLRPHIDGVIIHKESASATFLPQVWEQLPRPDQFLSHLCMKAGLAASQWQDGELVVQVYQVQSFQAAS